MASCRPMATASQGAAGPSPAARLLRYICRLRTLGDAYPKYSYISESQGVGTLEVAFARWRTSFSISISISLSIGRVTSLPGPERAAATSTSRLPRPGRVLHIAAYPASRALVRARSARAGFVSLPCVHDGGSAGHGAWRWPRDGKQAAGALFCAAPGHRPPPLDRPSRVDVLDVKISGHISCSSGAAAWHPGGICCTHGWSGSP